MISNLLSKLNFVNFSVIYLPIIVGLVFTGAGMNNYLESSRTYPRQDLPEYGIINLASEEFGPTDSIIVEIREISTQENSAEAMVTMILEAKEKHVQFFGLQVPGRVEDAYAKIVYMDEGKTNIFYDQGEAKIEWMPDRKVSIISYGFNSLSGTPWYSVEIGYRWLNVLTRTDFSTYELIVPFSRFNGVVDAPSGLMAFGEKANVILTVFLPEDAQLFDSIPQPSEETIDWHFDVGVRSLVFRNEIDFGMNPGWHNLPTFRVSFEYPKEQGRYDRLIFDSGLFLGIGIQFLLAGVFDAIKLKKNE